MLVGCSAALALSACGGPSPSDDAASLEQKVGANDVCYASGCKDIWSFHYGAVNCSGGYCAYTDANHLYTTDPHGEQAGPSPPRCFPNCSSNGWFADDALGRCLVNHYSDTVPLQRLYNYWGTDHYYAVQPGEIIAAEYAGYQVELANVCEVYTYQRAGTCPVYRLYSYPLSDHILTLSKRTRDTILAGNCTGCGGYGYDAPNQGIAFYMFPFDDDCPP
jgi:hypothetical protein